MLTFLKKIIPKKIFKTFQPLYHLLWVFVSALVYRFPSRHLTVIAITGTKGKTSTAEFVNAILEQARYKTALAGTLRFKIGNVSKNNLYKMTMPGWFVIQKFLRDAVSAGCTHAILEITSEGARQYRHKFIDLNALIVTNISPEHIESHGSYENYLKAKLSIAKSLESSPKKNKVIVVNSDDKESGKFLAVNDVQKVTYSLKDAGTYTLKENGVEFDFRGEHISSPLPGLFNIYNMLASATYAATQNIRTTIIKKAFENLSEIRGRMQKIEAGQDFKVFVDYAHTTDSLEKVYKTFPEATKICVLGNTGGGRDKWKRVEMAKIADTYCSHIILTNEDPYDEDPREIVEQMKKGISKNPCEIIMDRREAIGSALKKAKTGNIVFITGKGTDPYIMGPNGTKIPWSDAEVTREELRKILK